jgi:uncharacterized protein YraI
MDHKRRDFLRLAGILGTALGLGGPLRHLLAQTALTGTPTVILRLRSGPGTSFDSVGLVGPADALSLLGRNASGDWLYVEVARTGQRAWAAGWFISPTGDSSILPVMDDNAPSAAVSPSTVIATPTVVLRLRSGPGIEHAAVGLAQAGTPLAVSGRDAAGHWLQVTVSGVTGWIAGWFCAVTGDVFSLPVTDGSIPSATTEPAIAPQPGVVAQPAIVPRAGWGALPVDPSVYARQTPQFVTVHMDGELFGDYADPIQRLQTTQQWSINTHGWVDIPYHFMVDRQGRIYEGRPVWAVGDTGTNYDPTGHVSVTLLGDYDVQAVNRVSVNAVVDVAAWLCASYGIPPERVKGHRDYAYTSCPGEFFYLDYFATGQLVREVRARLGLA